MNGKWGGGERQVLALCRSMANELESHCSLLGSPMSLDSSRQPCEPAVWPPPGRFLSVKRSSVLQEAVGDRIPVLLLGNKLDNEKEREVPRGLGEQLAKVKSPYFPLSG